MIDSIRRPGGSARGGGSVRQLFLLLARRLCARDSVRQLFRPPVDDSTDRAI